MIFFGPGHLLDMETDGLNRGLGYLIPKPYGKIEASINMMPLSVDQLAEMTEVLGVALELAPIICAAEIVEQNYKELRQYFVESPQSIGKMFVEGALPNLRMWPVWNVLVQRITNFLASANSFLALTETTIGKNYGAGSDALAKWNEKRKELHRQSLAYRLCYDLRNYSQHYGLPITSLEVGGTGIVGEEDVVGGLRVRLSRDDLLAEGFAWKKSVVADIEAQDNDFDIEPLIDEYMGCIREACFNAIDLQGKRVRLCSAFLQAILNDMNLPERAVPVVFVGEPDGTKPPSNYQVLPVEDVERIRTALARHVSAQSVPSIRR
ncbi:hypothetical protein [Mesorhizobium australicum]|uniref:hypothetical protein n=1 Tax=Mesorhizobium australicum TaxID=536018 RepID=UPI00333D9169